MFIFLSCEKTVTLTESRNKTLIISAFPETGQSISDFSIRKFNDNGSFTIPVNDANPRIIWKNNSFGLIPSENQDGLYRLAADNFEFLPGNDYRLELNYKSEFITGQTSMPNEINEFEIASSIIQIYNSEGLLNPGTNINWRKEDNTIYSVSITPLEKEGENLISFPELSQNQIDDARNSLDNPFSSSAFTIPAAAFEYYGDNVIEIIAVDERFEEFFDLNENGTTFSNIKNGKGYFIGISKFSVIVKVE
ncbi:MAG: hypothetical protein AAF487_01135 [Bacteroidota bacterium]